MNVKQAKLTQTERKLVEIVVLATNQNHKFLAKVIDGSLNLGVKAIEIREALFAGTLEAGATKNESIHRIS